jgi:hypothetical protein
VKVVRARIDSSRLLLRLARSERPPQLAAGSSKLELRLAYSLLRVDTEGSCHSEANMMHQPRSPPSRPFQEIVA